MLRGASKDHHYRPALRAGVVLGLLLLPHAVDAKRDVLGNEPSVTQPDLVVHPAGTDLSAYRLDSEVFGWDREFTQVAGVGDEIYRGPKGKHRGEVFMLVYNLGETVPVHNVIVHTVTHADLPNDPVPIEDARDLMWTMEASYLGMWPKRPIHKRPKGAMDIETIWEPVPQGNDLCVPAVGFLLDYKGKRRFERFAQLDMKVHCPLLRQTDTRLYWGRKDVAASMVRFDFSPNDTNEKSARFIVSAAWKLAKEVNVVLEVAAPLPAAAEKQLRQRLSKLGKLRVRHLSSEGAGQNETPGISQIAAQPEFATLAQYLARTLRAGGTSRLEGGDGPNLVVHVGYVGAPHLDAPPAKPPLPATNPNSTPPPLPPPASADSIAAAARQTAHMGAPPPVSEMPAQTQPLPPTPDPLAPPLYLQTWQEP